MKNVFNFETNPIRINQIYLNPRVKSHNWDIGLKNDWLKVNEGINKIKEIFTKKILWKKNSSIFIAIIPFYINDKINYIQKQQKEGIYQPLNKPNYKLIQQ